VTLDLLSHIAIAVVLQLLAVRLAKSWVGGAIAGIAWVVSREWTQAEYRWIEQFGGGLRANLPWWGPLDPAVWSKADPWLDWIVPSGIVIGLAAWRTRKR
jgi:hypothetical protein